MYQKNEMVSDKFFPSVKEGVLVVVITGLFLILTAVCIGLRTEHFLMSGLFLYCSLQEKLPVNWQWHYCHLLFSVYHTIGCGYILIIR